MNILAVVTSDYIGIILLVALLFSSRIRRTDEKHPEFKIFTTISILTMVACVIDLLSFYVDGNNIPIFGMIIYLIDYKEENYSRSACGGYYRFEFDNSVLLPHPYQESICW